MVTYAPTGKASLKRFSAGIAVAVLAGALWASPAAAGEPATRPSTGRFEVTFLKNMIDHHGMAVGMAEMCLGKGVRPQLQSLCQNVKSSQSAQIGQMQGWLQDWYAVKYQPRMRPGDRLTMERLASKTGAAFEIDFMKTIIKHHRKAIREAEKCLARASHAELRELCRKIINAQTAEIAKLESWLCKWYERC